jgi:hypothetical protein
VAMKPNKINKGCLNRLTKTMVIIKESYYALENKTLCTNQNIEGCHSENTFTGYFKQKEANLHNVHIMKLFWAVLPQDNKIKAH